MAESDLKLEDVDQLLAYDPATGELRWKVSRGTAKAGSVTGCTDSKGYLRVKLHGKLYYAHRLAWLLHTGSWPSKHLDHKNGQKYDNRIENLRECDNLENHQNQKKRSDNISGVTGVSWNKQNSKWQSRICFAGKEIFLGLFTTIEEASAARAAAKQKYHKFQQFDRENN
ncbi:HNH endonuclease [Xanthomonas phage Xop411]|uniref:HNH endonuclease n=1 Tax=Xanthomonas phage Xop411 TaxID=2913975 RepID=A8B107_9CAUD|nr:HNH endonuclease [Xanthomonas phage Xop411]ABV26559.1 HNH endonuclease [Xanthomonas phage Xop411]